MSDNWGGGEGLLIHSRYARRISFEIYSNSKEIRRAEHEYMNKRPPISVLVTSLRRTICYSILILVIPCINYLCDSVSHNLFRSLVQYSANPLFFIFFLDNLTCTQRLDQ